MSPNIPSLEYYWKYRRVDHNSNHVVAITICSFLSFFFGHAAKLLPIYIKKKKSMDHEARYAVKETTKHRPLLLTIKNKC